MNMAGNESPTFHTMRDAMSGTEDLARLLSDLNVADVPDMEVLAAFGHRMEMLAAVKRIALDGAQAVARRHMEIMQQTMSEVTEALRSLATPSGSPQAKAAKQTGLLRRAYERSLSDTRELSELIRQSNAAAMELLGPRCSEELDGRTDVVETVGGVRH